MYPLIVWYTVSKRGCKIHSSLPSLEDRWKHIKYICNGFPMYFPYEVTMNSIRCLPIFITCNRYLFCFCTHIQFCTICCEHRVRILAHCCCTSYVSHGNSVNKAQSRYLVLAFLILNVLVVSHAARGLFIFWITDCQAIFTANPLESSWSENDAQNSSFIDLHQLLLCTTGLMMLQTISRIEV